MSTNPVPEHVAGEIIEFPRSASASELESAIAADALTRFDSVRAVSAENYFKGDAFAINSFKDKYAHPVSMYYGPDGACPLADVSADETRPETPAEAMYRVAHAVAAMEPTQAQAENMTAIWFHMLWNRVMVPGGRIFYGAGTRPTEDGEYKISLINCTTVGRLQDNIEAIYKAGYEVAKVQSRGEGVGVDITPLRPRGRKTNNAAKSTSGAVHWGELADWSTGAISQNGRRGALLISIEDHHPEAYSDFITVKSNLGKINNANISIKFTDTFMSAYENDAEFDLWWNDDKGRRHSYGKVSAREYMRKVAANACDFAEPGVLFWSTAQAYSNSDAIGWPIVGVNACSEQALNHLGQCTLAHQNWGTLPATLPEALVECEARARRVHHFLDNVVELQIQQRRSALPEQHDSLEQLRRVGAGFSGVADWLIRAGIVYDSEEAVLAVGELARAHCVGGYANSIALGKERGPFPANKPEIVNSRFMKRMLAEGIVLPEDVKWLRNVCNLTIAPVGTGSIMLQNYGSGIEPGFGSWRYRRTRPAGDWKWYFIVDPFVKRECENLTGEAWPFTDEQEQDPAFEEAIKSWLDARIPQELVRPVKYIDASLKTRLMGEVQKYIDSAISVTFNLVDAEPEDIERVYVESWRAKLKGCSVYVYKDTNREPIIQWTRPTTYNFEPKLEMKPEAVVMDADTQKRHDAAARPDRLPGETITRQSEGKRWYFTLSTNPDTRELAELFIATSDEKQGHPVPKQVLSAIETLMLLNGVPEDVIATQRQKAKGDRDYLKLSRLVSVALRWQVPLASIVDAIKVSAGELVVGSLLFHTVHLLEEYRVEPASYDRTCPACGSSELVFEAGCYSCASCNASKCG